MKPKEIGSEPTPDAFIKTMVAVFREVRRVLRDDGVIFVNLGDSYGEGTHGTKSNRRDKAECTAPAGGHRGESGNLLNIPHRVAEALRADGWIWRQTIVWAKRSPMPESVNGWRWTRCRVRVQPSKKYKNSSATMTETDVAFSMVDPSLNATWSDCPGCSRCIPNGGFVLRKGSGRCTTAHEYIFVFAKAPGYFWDGEASREAAEYGRRPFMRDAKYLNNNAFDNVFLEDYMVFPHSLDMMIVQAALENDRYRKLKEVAPDYGIITDEAELHQSSYDVYLTRSIFSSMLSISTVRMIELKE